MKYKIKFICSETRMSGGEAVVTAESLEAAKDILQKALYSGEVQSSKEEITYNYDYENEYLEDSFCVDEMECISAEE